MWHPVGADARRQRTCIDAGNSGDVVQLEPGVESRKRTIVGWMLRVGAHDQAPYGRSERLDVLAVGSDDPDMGKSEGYDLSGIGRIGKDLFIPGHRRVEA